MNRRLTSFTGLVLLGLASLCGTEANAAEKPNIIFIFADDWGWGDLSCHGHRYVKTPNIDRLAKEGTDFYRFTVASGVCSPSRTAVVTGHANCAKTSAAETARREVSPQTCQISISTDR